MKARKFWLALLAALISGNALAGVPEGLEAFKRGKFAEARKELTAPADEGDVQAMLYLGEMLLRGQGGKRDEAAAAAYLGKAHEAGNTRATFLLGVMHLQGLAFPLDESKGASMVRMAAEKGEAIAQTSVGVWLAEGSHGYVQDDVQALSWFRRAAEQKYPAAVNWLGEFTETGRGGIAADTKKALEWYKKAGMLGNSTAMTSIGRMHVLGLAPEVDAREAMRWLQVAVATGSSSAYYWLAALHEKGGGDIAGNPILAYAWYAALPGKASSEVQKKLAADGKARLEKTLSASDLQEAQQQAKNVVLINTLKMIGAMTLARSPNRNAPPNPGENKETPGAQPAAVDVEEARKLAEILAATDLAKIVPMMKKAFRAE